ncbi:CsbD family protein [Pseudoalteromonas prydzensis]|uniref:CsbD family protein n=1 Tax=Pseudoalteromonas prydzensis TaxID=182141 RepID=UPI0024BC175E|nr:hypothetical protein [Pseudoalteromonas prydzensis]
MERAFSSFKLVISYPKLRLDKIEGSRKELVGKIQQAYGKSKEEAEREVNDFEKGH